MASGEESGPDRVVLVGFMGSGKSSVGRALAELLGWSFRDFDDEIEAEVGASVPEIFRERGEPFFRRVEGTVGRRLLREERIVLASGGGWPASAGRMEELPPGTLSVWLRVSAEKAVSRSASDVRSRPLLEAADDPVARARELLRARTPHYEKAALTLDSEAAPPEALARTILESMRQGHEARARSARDG